MQIFGDKNTFAICYRPRPEWNTQTQVLIYCHLMLAGTIIGDPDEVDMLGTCVGALDRLRNKIINNEGKLSDVLFNGLSDDEIMELVYKSNQLEEEYNPIYAHLPAQTTNKLWLKHTVSMAESTDQHAIVVFEQNGQLKFLWQSWGEREKGLKTLNSLLVHHKTFYSAINQFLIFIKDQFPEQLMWLEIDKQL
jgi:hypothetical protein